MKQNETKLKKANNGTKPLTESRNNVAEDLVSKMGTIKESNKTNSHTKLNLEGRKKDLEMKGGEK